MSEIKNAAVELAVAEARRFLTLVGPRNCVADDLMDRMVLQRCRKCQPEEPHMFTCPICDFETEHKWKMQIHNASGSQICHMVGKRKEAAWCRDVGLDG